MSNTKLEAAQSYKIDTYGQNPTSLLSHERNSRNSFKTTTSTMRKFVPERCESPKISNKQVLNILTTKESANAKDKVE